MPYLFPLRSSPSHFVCYFTINATAKQAAAKTYFPIVAGINLFYLFIRFVYYKSSLTIYHTCMGLLLVAISFFAYKGILDDHANSSSGDKGEALAGGMSLDLLGLAILVQLGSFASDYFYWLLGLIPIVGGFKLYKTLKGGKEAVGGFMPDNAAEKASGGNVDSDGAAAKRQKRAERRRQK
ncbi:hypothetical protein ACHAXN_012043 [Cyclotella atomus]